MTLSSPPSEYKLGKNIKIAMLYLEDDDAVAAEQYIKKASSLLSGCKVRLQLPASRAAAPEHKKGRAPAAPASLAGGHVLACACLCRNVAPPRVVPQNEELELQYKTCYARILDSKRRFLEAATRYYELSQVGKRRIGSSEVRPSSGAAGCGSACSVPPAGLGLRAWPGCRSLVWQPAVSTSTPARTRHTVF